MVLVDNSMPWRQRSSVESEFDVVVQHINAIHTHALGAAPGTKVVAAAQNDFEDVDVFDWYREVIQGAEATQDIQPGSSSPLGSSQRLVIPRRKSPAQSTTTYGSFGASDTATGGLLRSPTSTRPSSSSVMSEDQQICKAQEETTWQYIRSLVVSVTDSVSIRGHQARLTMWELLEHFDFLNDLFFICRVCLMMQEPKFLENPQLQRIGFTSVLCLVCIWLISAVAYGCRRYIIYHRITASPNTHIFYPLIVFWKIRDLGETSCETLYMFHRLVWTYQVIMRLIEDIPQLFISAVFLANFGQNIYTYFMIAYSCALMVITSIRMGLAYPLFGTLSLILSRVPPVDSPEVNEAAPTTRNFFLFLAFTFAVWTVANGLCMCVVQGLAWAFFCTATVTTSILALLNITYWTYLNRQARPLATTATEGGSLLDPEDEMLLVATTHPTGLATISRGPTNPELELMTPLHRP